MESEIKVEPGQIWVHKVKRDFVIGISSIAENNGIIIATISHGEWLGSAIEGELFEYWDYCLANSGYTHPDTLQTDFELLAVGIPKSPEKSLSICLEKYSRLDLVD